jgi:LAS superfamily LD-carboxypeptidase LdcB
MANNGNLPPSDLAPIKNGQLRKDAAAAWNAMNAECRANGVELRPTGSKSSYRTYAQQVELWNLYQSGGGNLAARPGTSNHGWGIAVDLASQQMRSMLDRVGDKYGWSKRTSDAPSEWWHIRWREGSWRGADPGPEGRGAP